MAGYMKSDEYVSDFPFKNTWYELTIKRLIRYAADNGFDAIAIPKSSVIKKRWQMTGGMADNISVMNMDRHYRVKFMNEDGITLGNILFNKDKESLKVMEKKLISLKLIIDFDPQVFQSMERLEDFLGVLEI